MKKILWFSDTHFSVFHPWTFYTFLREVEKEKPNGIFLTGDIADGAPQLYWVLERMAKSIPSPIYFVLGNHCCWLSSMARVHQKVRELCQKHSNLIWMQDADVIHLSDEISILGADSWYSCDLGNTDYLKWTADWFLIEDFRKLPSWNDRIEAFRNLAEQAKDIVVSKLQRALEQDYKTVYILTHIPPWKEATRDEGSFLEKYWLPYNINLRMGKAIEDIMRERKKKRVVVLTGHTHSPLYVRVSRNVECQVGEGHYVKASHSQKLFM